MGHDVVLGIRIVSGGQTGVDRAALDAALAAGVPCGGWCPEGRLAEDGAIPEGYPVRELPGGGYHARTRRNVLDSDATLVVTVGPPSGGTAATLEACRQLGRPVLVVDAAQEPTGTAVARLEAFVEAHRVGVLNVAGPRASGAPGAYALARAVLDRFLAAREG
ncbi:MAG: putative molybdenum carrier protein [Gammaproteobacteria bacterium]|nr:putative molybdenum carrier protein [Gammaproteobacteria bacterium]